MIRLFTIALLVSVAAAQVPGSQTDWRSALSGLPERAPAGTSLRDVQRFEQNVRLAAPYLAAPGNVEANREYVRRMWTYLAALDVIARTPGADRSLDPAVRRVRGLLYGMGLAYPYWMTGGLPFEQQQNGSVAEPPPVKAGQPPFPMQAPDLGKVDAQSQEEADELTGRYETTAARAASAWQSADVLRQSLSARGMTLNVRATESVIRLQLFLEMAAGDLRRHDWKAARENLQRVEYVIGQVANTAGR